MVFPGHVCIYIYPSHFNCTWAVGHVQYTCMYTVTWAHAQSCHVKMEKEQSKCDHAEMAQEQSKRDGARARKRKQRDTASEESKTLRLLQTHLVNTLRSSIQVIPST